MNKVKVKVNTIHLLDNKEEKISYNAQASLIKTDKYSVLSYIDPSLDVNDRIIIKSNDEQIIIQRQGQIKSKMVFNKKMGSFGSYEIESFNVDLQINLKDFISKDNRLKLDYDLYIGNQYGGLFKTEITFA